MGNDYDVIVLGGGAPGEHCVAALVEGGLRVALVKRELLGGECSYWACIPSETLLRAGEAMRELRGDRLLVATGRRPRVRARSGRWANRRERWNTGTTSAGLQPPRAAA